jgi:hypothetical protein
MNNLEKIVFKLIDEKTADCDKYNNNGSLWLIFTDKKRWVLEYTDQGVLWYNYTFFNDIFSWLGLTDKKNEYITKWFESRFLGIGVKHTKHDRFNQRLSVEDTIQNGVKDIIKNRILPVKSVENITQNGVKHTDSFFSEQFNAVEDTIQNGVKDTAPIYGTSSLLVEDTIQNGIKEIKKGTWWNALCADEIIQNGVKDIKSDNQYIYHFRQLYKSEQTIVNGVKHTEDGDWLDNDDRIEEIIQNGVKQ